jgi:hypothetical protein
MAISLAAHCQNVCRSTDVRLAASQLQSNAVLAAGLEKRLPVWQYTAIADWKKNYARLFMKRLAV